MVWLLFWLPTCTPDSFLARLPVWIFSGLATWFCAKKPTWFLARLPVRLSDWFLMLIWLLVKLVRRGSSSQPELPCATIIALLLTTIFYAKTIFLSIKSNKLGNITVSPNSLPRYFHRFGQKCFEIWSASGYVVTFETNMPYVKFFLW